MVALGIFGFLVLALAFFFIGLLCIGPMVRNHFQKPSTTAESPSSYPSLRHDTNTPPAEEEKQPGLDIEITEQGVDSSSDQTSSEETGVKQDDNGLTITLEPNKTNSDRSDESKKSDSIEKPRTTTQNSTSKSSYRVQAGTFADKNNADKLVQELKDKGYRPEVKSTESGDRTLYRVQVGAYKSREAAQDFADELTSSGYSPSVVEQKE